MTVLAILGSLVAAFATWLTWYLNQAGERKRLRELAEKEALEAAYEQALAARDAVAIGAVRQRMLRWSARTGHPL